MHTPTKYDNVKNVGKRKRKEFSGGAVEFYRVIHPSTWLIIHLGIINHMITKSHIYAMFSQVHSCMYVQAPSCMMLYFEFYTTRYFFSISPEHFPLISLRIFPQTKFSVDVIFSVNKVINKLFVSSAGEEEAFSFFALKDCSVKIRKKKF